VDNADDMDLVIGNADRPKITDYLPQSKQGWIWLDTARSAEVAGVVVESRIIKRGDMDRQEAQITAIRWVVDIVLAGDFNQHNQNVSSPRCGEVDPVINLRTFSPCPET